MGSLDDHPVLWCSSIELFVIKGLKWQPSTWCLGWVSEFDAQIKEQFFDVELLEIDNLFLVLALFDYAESLLHGGLLLLLSLLGWWLISVRIEPRNGRCWSLLLEHETGSISFSTVWQCAIVVSVIHSGLKTRIPT